MTNNRRSVAGADSAMALIRRPHTPQRARRWTPLAVGLFALLLLNLGLYTRLVPHTQPPPAAPPIAEAVPAQAPPAPVVPTIDPTTAEVALGAESLLLGGNQPATLDTTGWLAFGGEWALEQGELVQRQPQGYDFGISYAKRFQGYRLRVRFHHLTGCGAGLMFNMPLRDNKAGAHYLRYSDDCTGLFWGYFDTNSTFSGQGFAPTAAPSKDLHTLEVISEAKTYRVLLDGAVVAQDVPLLSSEGYVALVSSQSSVAFNEVAIAPLASVAPSEVAAGPLTLNIISGDWAWEDTLIWQRAEVGQDYAAGLGVAASRYRLDVAVVLPEQPAVPDVGGGVIFHMPERDQLAGAQAVRFSENGKIIFWGAFGNDGVFVGRGNASLAPGSGPRLLSIIVRPGSYDILVDGQTVAKDIQAEQQGPWIGLLSFAGPIRFRDIRLSLQ